MDDDVARCEGRPVGVVQSQSVVGHVTGDRADASGDGGEVVAVSRAEAVERVVLEDLALGALGGRRALAVAYEQDEFAVGDRTQQPLDERGADEARGAGDGDLLPREFLGDHG